MSNYQNQRGVALLFALGILSLILVTGLAFLGNSLISQKIAFNSQESNAARLLARSAADRAIAQLAMFHIAQAANHAQYYTSDASSVFSRISTGAVSVAGASQITTSTNEADAISQDQLAGLNSKLNADVAEFGSPTVRYPWYRGQESRAKWIYVHRDGSESAGNGTDRTGTSITTPIIGRYAYQALPETSSSRLSLYAVTRGSYRNLHPAVGTAATTNIKPAKLYRWGIDVDELLINDPLFRDWGGAAADNETAVTTDSADLSQREFDTFFNIHSGNAAALYLSDIATDAQKMNVELRKRWVKNIFSEGMGRLAREAYAGDSTIPIAALRTWYPRFNLSDFKPYFTENQTDGIWYSRFILSTPSDAATEATRIADLKNGLEIPGTSGKTVLDYLAGYTRSPYIDSNVKDRDYDAPIGLPFLRRIGSDTEKGAFGSVADLRKQIAANLNDYCDADDIPTSDVPASNWAEAVTGTRTPPSYTGNEKTPYINEVGFSFKLGNAGFSSGENYVFSAKVVPEALVELIKIYRDIYNSINNYSFIGQIKHLELVLRVTVKGTADFYEMKDGVENKFHTADLTEKEITAESSDGIFVNSSAPVTLNLTRGVFTGDGPYWLANNQQVGTEVTVRVDLTDKIKEQVSGTVLDDKTISKIDFNLTNVKVEIARLNFQMGNMVLLAPDPSDSNQNIGVDFVKDNSTTKREISSSLSLYDGDKAGFEEKLGSGKEMIAFCGGMEAIDPRQNLNANLVQDTNNDWRNVTASSFTFAPVDGVTQTYASTGSWQWGNLSTRVTGGAVNDSSKHDADPNVAAPKYADGSFIPLEKRDVETAPDPAWRGANPGEHISTAVIRNAPMRSPWELGFIHRGIPFQTINLKKTGGINDTDTLAESAHGSIDCTVWDTLQGTTYANGDAGILDQIKMTEYNKSYGKVDFSVLKETDPAWRMGLNVESFNKSVFESLFLKLERHASAQAFIDRSSKIDSATGYVAGRDIPNPVATSVWDAFKALNNTMRRSSLLDPVSYDGLGSKFGTTLSGAGNDAQQEELIGRSINLMEGATCSVPNVFRIIVVAQTIRDFSDEVVRLDSDSNVRRVSGDLNDTDKGLDRQAALGRFDAYIGTDLGNSIYYDEILSECRMLVTVEKVHYMDGSTPRARLRVKQIEYLD